MSPTPPAEGPSRSADDINAAIRALWSHPAARLDDEQRAEYHRLLGELRRVERGDVTEAA